MIDEGGREVHGLLDQDDHRAFVVDLACRVKLPALLSSATRSRAKRPAKVPAPTSPGYPVSREACAHPHTARARWLRVHDDDPSPRLPGQLLVTHLQLARTIAVHTPSDRVPWQQSDLATLRLLFQRCRIPLNSAASQLRVNSAASRLRALLCGVVCFHPRRSRPSTPRTRSTHLQGQISNGPSSATHYVGPDGDGSGHTGVPHHGSLFTVMLGATTRRTGGPSLDMSSIPPLQSHRAIDRPDGRGRLLLGMWGHERRGKRQ